MKAAVYYETGLPDVFRYEELPEPPCHPNGVVIDVQAVGIEGGDVLNRAGGAIPKAPHVVGYNCAGTIREIGPQVTDRRVGQRVMALMAFGSHASVASVPAAATWLVPDGVAIEHAACVPVAWGTAHDCLFEFGRLQKGETALIQAGASGVGLACVQLAHRAGARVLATAGSAEKIERLKQYGLDEGINYRETDFVKEAQRLTEGRGVDLVVDSVGDTLQGSLQVLGYRARAITVGNVSRSDKKIDPSPMSEGNRSLTGVFFGAEVFRNAPRVNAMLNQILADIEKGELKVVIDKTFPLSEAAAAHAYIESRAAFGRVVLVP
ncbi:MAG TPA: zinc-binding alcohol dehydrogenase family protein [Dehalococcoidia bacterium]